MGLLTGVQISHPSTLQDVAVYKKGGLSIVMHSLFMILYAWALLWCYDTAGDPLFEVLAEQAVKKAAAQALEMGMGVEKSDDDKTLAELLAEDPNEAANDSLPSSLLPGFWACVALAVVVSSHIFFMLCCHWIVSLKAIMQYRAHNGKTLAGCYVKVVPPNNKGVATMELVHKAASGTLFFTYQRNRYDIVPQYVTRELINSQDTDGTLDANKMIDRGPDCEGIQRVVCPINLPLEDYIVSATGYLDEDDLFLAKDRFGLNEFEVPIPDWLELFLAQLVSPLVVFQVFCCVLWMLDQYWKYTCFTLFMILSFEAGTAFSRKKNLNTLKGMSNKPFEVMVFRRQVWTSVLTTQLLPGDLVSLKREGSHGSGGTIIPCDCVILKGSAVANESTLTGESVPQLRDALPLIKGDAIYMKRQLDMHDTDRVHILFSGTLMMQHSAGSFSSSSVDDEAGKGNKDNEDEEDRTVQDLQTPNDGCLCYVLRTGFNSCQGELMKMIENSQASVQGDKKETMYLLLLLLCFAFTSAAYVLKRGLEEGKQTKYKLLLRCVQILTSVVPPELPMQAGLAVNTALMALLKAGIFCTQPYRVPLAGKLTHCLFDKTGTLTTDQLEAVGVISMASKSKKRPASSSSPTDSTSSSAAVASPTATQYGGRDLDGMEASSMELQCVVAGCHSLMTVDGQLMGDTIETAALRAVKWSFDAVAQVATEGVPPPATPFTAAVVPVVVPAPVDGVAPVPVVAKAIPWKPPADAARIHILHRYRFSSALQRMSSIVTISQCRGSDGSVMNGTYVLVKGSPEAVGALLLPSQMPTWYANAYRSMAESGIRVLAFAYKKFAVECQDTETASQVPRPKAEEGLYFAGFIAFRCRTRTDSSAVVRSLIQSNHRCMMLTGDSAFTALHVAAQVGMTSGDSNKALLLVFEPTESASSSSSSSPSSVEGSFFWVNCCQASSTVTTRKFALLVDQVSKLAKEYDLIVSGRDFQLAVDRYPELWQVVEHIAVFARMTPQHKQKVVETLKSLSYFCLMCGDGGNDVGALKAADIGLALLGGFGNVNADKKLDSEKGGKGEGEADKKAEEELNALKKGLEAKLDKSAKLSQLQMKEKRNALLAQQKVWMEEEVEAQRLKGNTGFMVHMQAMQSSLARMKKEMAEIQGPNAAKAKEGGALGAHVSSMLSNLETEEGDAAGLPMIKPGDASVAAPFTSKMPSIVSCVDIIRQGRCTLVNTIQQQQILVLNCMISAYSLAALSLQGSRNSEAQMIATGLLLTTAVFAFSFTKPLDSLSPVRPLQSIFHPALFISILGQMCMHLVSMVYAVEMAKAVMGEDELTELIKFNRRADKEYLSGNEEASTRHKPNLLNTVVFLVETAQQVSVMAVNYKGRPWTRSVSENPALLWSLACSYIGLGVCAWEVIPELNKYLGLVSLPDDSFRFSVISMLCLSIFGTYCWDRLCVYLFAREVAASAWSESQIRWSDVWSSGSKIGGIILALALIGGLELNILHLGMIYFAYTRYKKGVAADAASTTGDVDAAAPAAVKA